MAALYPTDFLAVNTRTVESTLLSVEFHLTDHSTESRIRSGDIMTEQEFRKKLAENLVKYRKLNGLTQQELADCISYSDKSVSKWERGDGVPDVFVLLNIAQVCGVGVSELIGESGESKETAALIKAQEKNEKAKDKAKKKAMERAHKQKKRERKKK